MPLCPAASSTDLRHSDPFRDLRTHHRIWSLALSTYFSEPSCNFGLCALDTLLMRALLSARDISLKLLFLKGKKRSFAENSACPSCCRSPLRTARDVFRLLAIRNLLEISGHSSISALFYITQLLAKALKIGEIIWKVFLITQWTILKAQNVLFYDKAQWTYCNLREGVSAAP